MYQESIFSVFCKRYDPKLGDVMVIVKENLDRADIFLSMALVRNIILATSEHCPDAYLGYFMKQISTTETNNKA